MEGSYKAELGCALPTRATSWKPRRDSWGLEERVDATMWQQAPESGAHEGLGPGSSLGLEDGLALHMHGLKEELRPSVG